MTKKDYSNFTKEELLEEVKKLEKRKKYGIVWEDKPEKVAEMCKEKLPVLEEDTKKEIVTDKEKDYNIIIEGDNYHALSVLNYTHAEKIDVIYIDPPYNTGKQKEWTYNDRFVDQEDSFRHSKWLSFMEKRLKLAKSLLKDDGLLFISIDDNEFSQLKVLCDEIFLDNFIATLIWRKSAGVGNDTKYFASDHEYVLVYSKNKDKLSPFFVNLDEEIKRTYKYKDNNFNKLGPYKRRSLLYKLPEMNAKRPNLKYPIKCPDGQILRPATIWKWGEARFLKAESENRIEFIKNKRGEWKVYFKMYLYENGKERKMKPRTILLNVGMTKDGTNELKEIFGRKVFDYPKPTTLIQHLLQIHPNKEATILDFFAGTGTTAHAVLKINNNDGGSRKFILCTNNENNICTEICYPRVKWVIQKLEKESKSKLIGKSPGNLKYFKTDFVDAEPTDKNKERMVKKSTEMLCLKEDCFEELAHGDKFKIFTDNKEKLLGIVYGDEGIANIKKMIIKLNKKLIVYVFSLDDSAREDQFEDVKNLVELRPIPAVILNVYRRIFK